MTELERMIEEALRMKPRARAALAERMLASLDRLSPEEIEELWADEAERRLADIESGRARTIPAEEVLEKAKRLLP
jgi:putative addiction module component (TIGR02574 family)